jgi:DNA-binding beta-propeller fold protein YncE
MSKPSSLAELAVFLFAVSLFAFSVHSVAGPARAQEGDAKAGRPPTRMIYPIDVAVDGKGNAYVVDLKLPGVWKIESGKVSIYARGRKQFKTPLNAARCATFGKQGLLVGDSASTSVLRIVDGKPLKSHAGRIGIPAAVATTASGDVLVADLELRRIWKYSSDGGPISLFAEVDAPRGLTVDGKGQVWVVTHGRNQVVRLSSDGKSQEVLVPGRPFKFPHHIVVNDAGDAFVADGYGKAIWKIPAGGKPEKLAADGPLQNPVGLAIRGDRLLVADPHAKAIFEVDPDGVVTKIVGAD